MAANPPCQFEGCEEPATFTGTFFDSGLSVIVCGDHFVAFAGGTLEALTGVPVLDIIATVGAEPEVEDSATELVTFATTPIMLVGLSATSPEIPMVLVAARAVENVTP